jgi:hypothetical protein
MFVTSFYNIYENQDRFFEYMTLFYDIAISGIPIVIFVDPSIVHKLRIFPSSVHVVGLSLQECEIYRLAIAYTGELPVNRTVTKDTKEFLGLMNCKPEFLKRAATLFPADKYIWIDVGIMKIIKNHERCITKLHEIESRTFAKITFGGCWSFGRPMNVDQIHWRVAGGMIVIPSGFIYDFYNHCKGVVRDFCSLPQYKLTWETNIWSIVELFALKDTMQWYYCDHNDSLIMNC